MTIEVSKKLHRTQEILKYILWFKLLIKFFLQIVMVYDSDNDAFQEMTIVFYVNKCHIVGALNDMALPIFECSLWLAAETMSKRTSLTHWNIEMHSFVFSWMLILSYFEKKRLFDTPCFWVPNLWETNPQPRNAVSPYWYPAHQNTDQTGCQWVLFIPMASIFLVLALCLVWD